jgi:deoxyribodipyrimidine photolyase
VELFFKDVPDLQRKVEFLGSHGVSSFNLVNKHRHDDMDTWVDAIREVAPDAHVSSHCSIKYNRIIPRKGPEEQKEGFVNVLSSSKADEILIVSGSGGDKTAWNAVSALQAVSEAAARSPSSLPLLAVAYNPYFLDPDDQERENRRLQDKLATGCVGKVYLQFGSDLGRLKTGLEYLDRLNAVNGPKSKAFEIAGSLFLPTKRLIAQQKFRPWNGVFLSQEFLSGPDHATGILQEMMKLYDRHDVEILWEAPGIRTEKDLDLVNELLRCIRDENSKEGGIDMADQDTAHGTESSPPERKRRRVGRNQPSRSCDPCLLLFGSHDLRLRDNKALAAAAERHEQVLPVFLWTARDRKQVTGAVQVVLKSALESLEVSLDSFGLPLICCNCPDNDKDSQGIATLQSLIDDIGAKAVFWNRECTTEGRERESVRRDYLEKKGITVFESQSSLLYDPDKMDLTSGFRGGHWGTLMPFLKYCKKQFGEPDRPTPYHVTHRLLGSVKAPLVADQPSIQKLEMAVVAGKQKWDEPIKERFPMTEKTAHEAMESFVRGGLKKYEQERSRADKRCVTSELSHHFRIGTLSPNQLYWRIEDSGMTYDKIKTFSRRLFWRDLAYYQLYCFPDMRYRCIRSHYKETEWVCDEEEERRFRAWKRGQTGFPIVDAAMRELYETGWMTQSIRMVAASFLVEYLRVNWTKGCEWFHYTLVDADAAINAMMWQNAGKSGIDQWNFVLSPTTASQDPSGDYTRRWVPELSKLPNANLVHRPWEATPEQLKKANVVLGKTYPHRIVEDLKVERQKGIDATLSMRRNHQEANSDRGYDMITLPNGERTVVFTKKEYRIDGNGSLINEKSSSGKGQGKKTPPPYKTKSNSKRAARAKAMK